MYFGGARSWTQSLTHTDHMDTALFSYTSSPAPHLLTLLKNKSIDGKEELLKEFLNTFSLQNYQYLEKEK